MIGVGLVVGGRPFGMDDEWGWGMRRRKILRILTGVLALAVGLPVLAYAGLVAINWNDEAPSAQAERLAAVYRDRPVVADEDNGRVRMERLVTEAEAGFRAARPPTVVALSGACKDAEACAAALDADPGALRDWLEAEHWLLDRYRHALGTTGWREELPVDGTAPWPSYQPMLDAQMLHLLDARRLALAGDAAAVRDLLESDLVFWRNVLASSDLLATKMVAVAAAGRNLEFGTLALRGLPSDVVEAAVSPSWRAPLTVPERSLVRTMAGEWHFSGRVLRNVVSGAQGETRDTLGDRLALPLLQEQATLNQAAARMLRVGELSELPHAELAAAVEGLMEEPAPPGYSFYNPLGTMLGVGVAPGLYAKYVVRTADLEGRRRIALLAATLRASGTEAGEAEAAVRGASLRNPYDDTSFEWDPAGGAVVFNGLEQGDRGRHAVRL